MILILIYLSIYLSISLSLSLPPSLVQMGFAGIAVGAAMVSFLSSWHHRLLGLYYWD